MAPDTLRKVPRFEMVKQRHQKTFENAVEIGKADEKLIPLCKYIAGTENYFTSSSCSGRILLLGLGKGERKENSSFCGKWHGKVSFSEVKEALEEHISLEIWFKQEPFILHIGAQNIEGAKKILSAMYKAGIKRGGIIVAKEGKYLVELQGTQEMALPVKKGSEILVEDGYLKKIIETANKKLEKNDAALKRLERVFRDELK